MIVGGDGNVTRIITEVPAPGEGGEEQAAMPGDGGEEMPNPAIVPGEGEGGGATELVTPPLAEMLYSAVRFGYAQNARTVVFAHGETWTGSNTCPSDYQITWAREFRYDGARARYMNRKLNPDLSTATGGTVWSDYDGDEAYGDFTVTGSTATNVNSYEPGLWGTSGTTSDYIHADLAGTLRKTSSTTGDAGNSRVFTAFGERIAGTIDRFGYAGDWGYQGTLDNGGTEVFPFLHLGARYYDPTSGRFLQRDPVGIRGGINVYNYVDATPTAFVDPTGNGKHSVLIKSVKGIWKIVNRGSAVKGASKEKQAMVIGSKREAKRFAEEALGDGVVHHGPHKPGQMPHYQKKKGDGRHVFHRIPGAAIGVSLIGDNLLGNAADFFNPLSDIQDLIDLGCMAFDAF